MAALGLDPDDFGSPDAPDVAGEDVEATPPAPVLAVVGRPNVGKSTLVNRMLGRREAVVQDIPGVTRDRVAYDAMRTADAVLLVVDASVGATATDEAVARVLRRSDRPVLLAATKVDDDRLVSDTAALWRRRAAPGRAHRQAERRQVQPAQPRVRRAALGGARRRRHHGRSGRLARRA